MVQIQCHTAGNSILPMRHNERRVIQFSYGMNTVRVACRRLKILVHVEKSCLWYGISAMLVHWTPGVCAASLPSLSNINVASSTVPFSPHVKLLGVTLDNSLSLNPSTGAIRRSGYKLFVKWRRYPGAWLERYLQNGDVIGGGPARTLPAKWRHYLDGRLYT